MTIYNHPPDTPAIQPSYTTKTTGQENQTETPLPTTEKVNEELRAQFKGEGVGEFVKEGLQAGAAGIKAPSSAAVLLSLGNTSLALRGDLSKALVANEGNNPALSLVELEAATLALAGVNLLTTPKQSDEEKNEFYNKTENAVNKISQELDRHSSKDLESNNLSINNAIAFVNKLEKNPNFIKYSKESDNLRLLLKPLKEKIKAEEYQNIQRDMKIIQKNCQKSIAEAMNKGEFIKLSRHEFTDITHSYIINPEGKLFQQYHLTKGVHEAHVADDKVGKIVLGRGGYKTAKKIGGELVTAVVHRTDADLTNAINATKVEEFRNCENLLVGHYMTYVSKKTGEVKQVFIGPFMSSGDLSNNYLSPKEIVSANLQAAKGLQVMHQKGWAHFDIKPENLFIKRDDKGNMNVRLADFDLADQVANNPEKTYDCGTPWYMSPEMHAGEVKGKNALESDIFSFGITLLETAGFTVNTTNKNFAALLPGRLESQSKSNPKMKALLELGVSMLLPSDQRPNIDEVVTKLEQIEQQRALDKKNKEKTV